MPIECEHERLRGVYQAPLMLARSGLTCRDCGASMVAIAGAEYERLQERERTLGLAYAGAVDCAVEDSAKLARLSRMAAAGEELKDWAHTASALVQWCATRGMEDAERTIGPLREAIAAYEQASAGEERGRHEAQA